MPTESLTIREFPESAEILCRRLETAGQPRAVLAASTLWSLYAIRSQARHALARLVKQFSRGARLVGVKSRMTQAEASD